MTKKIEETNTHFQRPVQFRVRRTTVDGERGWVWEWAPVGTRWEQTAEWSDPNGPVATRAEAREWALETIAMWEVE